MKFFYLLPFSCLLVACGSSRNTTSNASPTVKRTVSGDPRFIETIRINPGEDGPGAGYSPNTGLFGGPAMNSYAASGNIESSTALQFKYAILLDENVENLNNIVLLQYIDDWYGTKYRYGGSTRQGIDCSAFVNQLSSAVFGKTLPRTSREQFDQSQKIPLEYLQTGDLVFFNTRGGVSHVGVYLLHNKFVHASTSSGVVISDLNEEYYKRRLVGAGRY
ncbi:C40 family peptidase [Flavihumibacter petaseus]|uniref:Murein DD-endopeptidase n=1 Tax=Flavihumibacter petaseus NBRC 106054 TaxID=1220578 RepID=A0A0E9N3T6_9BACT|nr:NlpC/P60 family protein [Flavihumibacter petaseus]GAO44346.1 murein DD-endopeptidase [Flavihumibacter petaseus NBRC 106054]